MSMITRKLCTAMGQRALLDAKIKEFEGLRFVGDVAGAELCRDHAHTLLDSLLDEQAEFAVYVRRNGFS